MSAFSARAAGKVILFGEHAVVYGVPGLAAGMSEARARRRGPRPRGNHPSCAWPDVSIRRTVREPIKRAFAALLGDDGAAVEVDAEADLPPGGGLGCSAALAVAIARSVIAARRGAAIDPSEDTDRVLERAAAWEAVFHGNPSGIDTAAAAHGGCLRFERKGGAVPIDAPNDLWLAVGYSGKGASTKEMVTGLARRFDRKPGTSDKFLGAVRSLVENAILAIAARDNASLGKLLDLNQMLLAGVMLSTEPIEAMCRSARAEGALGAKLTGSGGGGSVIALGGSCDPGATGSDAEAIARAVATAWLAARPGPADASPFAAFTTRIAASKGTKEPSS